MNIYVKQGIKLSITNVDLMTIYNVRQSESIRSKRDCVNSIFELYVHLSYMYKSICKSIMSDLNLHFPPISHTACNGHVIDYG